MSRIIRTSSTAETIIIGERHIDKEQEAEATSILKSLFPKVEVVSDMDGARFIPVIEAIRMKTVVAQERATAEKAGYNQGHRDGLTKGQEDARKTASTLDTVIADAIRQREQLLVDAKARILDLVVQISRKVTFDAVSADPETTTKMISGVIDTLIDRSRLVIKVNPDHLPLLEQQLDTFLTSSTSIKELRLEADPRVRFGGCFIETPTGDIDARLESQFGVIEDVIKGNG
ncbi:MAG: FliH/SctL family protein [Candidatus Zixiibacteriota bacterium]